MIVFRLDHAQTFYGSGGLCGLLSQEQTDGSLLWWNGTTFVPAASLTTAQAFTAGGPAILTGSLQSDESVLFTFTPQVPFGYAYTLWAYMTNPPVRGSYVQAAAVADIQAFASWDNVAPPAGMNPGPWDCLPYVTNVTYTSVNAGGNVTFTLSRVIRSPIKRIEKGPSYGVYKQALTTWKIDPFIWSMWAPTGIWPKMRDQLTVNGLTWTVHRDVDAPTNLAGVGGLWRLPSTVLEIDSSLNATVQYIQATCTGSSATGARTVTDTNVGSPVAAAVQPFNADLGVMFGTKDFEDHYLIYLSADPSGTGTTAINAGDLFQDGNGVKYEIIEALNRNLLDELPTFHCVKKL